MNDDDDFEPFSSPNEDTRPTSTPLDGLESSRSTKTTTTTAAAATTTAATSSRSGKKRLTEEEKLFQLQLDQALKLSQIEDCKVEISPIKPFLTAESSVDSNRSEKNCDDLDHDPDDDNDDDFNPRLKKKPKIIDEDDEVKPAMKKKAKVILDEEDDEEMRPSKKKAILTDNHHLNKEDGVKMSTKKKADEGQDEVKKKPEMTNNDLKKQDKVRMTVKKRQNVIENVVLEANETEDNRLRGKTGDKTVNNSNDADFRRSETKENSKKPKMDHRDLENDDEGDKIGAKNELSANRKKAPVWNAPRFESRRNNGTGTGIRNAAQTSTPPLKMRVGLSRNFKAKTPLHSKVKFEAD